MFIDADHLKYINDTFGHDMGNLEIRGIADGIRKVFPPEAVSMRYGGDEFVDCFRDVKKRRLKV